MQFKVYTYNTFVNPILQLENMESRILEFTQTGTLSH